MNNPVYVQRASNYTQPTTTQEHNQNRTRGLPKGFTPLGSKYNLNILFQPFTIHESNIRSEPNICIRTTNRRLLLQTFKVCNIQHCNATNVILTTVQITVNHQSCIFYELNARHPDVLLMTINIYKYRQNTTDLLYSTISGLHVSTPQSHHQAL